MKIRLPADMAIDAEVDLCQTGEAYFLQARLNVSLPGLEREVAALVHQNDVTTLPRINTTHASRRRAS
jgi:osmotically inducible protein OsmC